MFYDAQSHFSLCVKKVEALACHGLKSTFKGAERFSAVPSCPRYSSSNLACQGLLLLMGLMHFFNSVWCCLLSWLISAWLPLFPFGAFLSHVLFFNMLLFTFVFRFSSMISIFKLHNHLTYLACFVCIIIFIWIPKWNCVQDRVTNPIIRDQLPCEKWENTLRTKK